MKTLKSIAASYYKEAWLLLSVALFVWACIMNVITPHTSGFYDDMIAIGFISAMFSIASLNVGDQL